jgi:hypothetical protein
VSSLELGRPRDITALFGDSLRVFRRHALTFLALSAAVVVPVELIVSGIGLEELTASYDRSPPAIEQVIPTAVSYLVLAPLITAACIYALRDVAAGERPRPGQAITEGLEAFTPIFFAIVLAALGIALGLLLLIVPGVYVAVRWYFVPQAVVLQNARGAGALTASGQTVQGFWWRTLGIVVLANLAAALPGLVLVGPFSAIADSTDRALWALVGRMAAEIVTAPFVAIVATLLYFDLRARRS